ncbi:hypothetical protein [Natronomonas gomsonensis]|uniref:hypothetical protein n=1 Tax=Natronomonas gomsonensis TaxID=1046043 RepID=UPI0015BF6BD4|nr:hypothetical protein [Natronomonas gomsonensis]
MTDTDPIANVDLTGSDYVIKRSLFRTEFRVYDDSGTLVLKTRRKRFEMRETFPLLDSSGRPAYDVEAGSVFEFAGDYTLTEAGTDDVIAVLERDCTSFKHVWRVRSPDGDLWAVIESQRTLLDAARNVVEVIGWRPREYTITGPNGEAFGRLEGRFSLWDTHDLHVGDSGDAPKESLVAAAIAIDALEGN